jgi:hemoglobin
MDTIEITEEAIDRLVRRFYAKVRLDPELGPIFLRAIPGDWEPHFATMRRFWSSVMLTSGCYKGNPVAVHHRVEGIELGQFDRWLALFDETCNELFTPATAVAFGTKARRIAESLKLGLFYRPDRPWPPIRAA